MRKAHACPTCGKTHHADADHCYWCIGQELRALGKRPFVSKRCTRCEGFFSANYDQRNWRLCPTCRDGSFDRRWHSRITSIVHNAVSLGILPKLDGSIPCVDCGKPATDYDHRDYNRPLDVDPTCHSCNLKRGPAIPLRSVNVPAPTSEAA